MGNEFPVLVFMLEAVKMLAHFPYPVGVANRNNGVGELPVR
jgi:hypothetical protein